MQGSESLGTLFRYVIELQTPDAPDLTEVVTANINVKQLVGKEFNVIIELEGRGFMAGIGAGTREINGLVTSARFVRAENRRGIYEILLEPWLVLATRTSDYKIFQNKTVVEIIQEVLADYTYPMELRLSNTYPPRVFQTQYGETDADLLFRLMQEWGISTFWEHKGGKHTLILVDDAGAHRPFDSAAYQTVNFYGPTAKIDEEYISQFATAESLQPSWFVQDDFDFTKPRARLQNKIKMPRKTGHNTQELYKWPGDFFDADEGRALTRVRMEEAGAPGSRGQGSGNLRAMVPGCTFKLQKYPQDKANKEYLIIAASLSLHESSHASGQAGYSCHTEFQVQPANKTFRSPQTVEKPFTAGPQTAIVTGPAGEEIYCDAYGRIKVSFHWNRYCTKDENSSCWIRVVTPWAASNFGMVAIPRIGTEVAIAFEGGDPDRPIVMGQVYNALNMPPWELPGNMTQSGIKTRSTLDGAPGAGLKAGGGDANALRFEDKKGQEQLWVHAQKDFLSETENDENKWVGRDRVKTIDRDETNHIKCDRTETVHRNEDITVHNDRTERVDHNEKVSIGDNQDLSVGINRSKSVGHNETDDIGTKWSIDVGKVKTENIGIADMLTVGLARMMSVGGVYSQNIGMLMNTVVGVIQSAQIGMTKTTTVGTNYKLTVGGGGGGDAGAGAGAPMNVVAESPAEGGDAAGGGGAGAILEMDAEKISLTIGKATFILNFDGTLTAKGVDFKFLASGDILVKAGGNIKFQANQIDEN